MSGISVLYITHDGIADHIGQSQVAPYLVGLAQQGHRITLLSAEKIERREVIGNYRRLFREHGIEWHYLPYHNRPPMVSTVWDLWRMRRLACRLVRQNRISAVHCRSYMPSLIGLYLKRKLGVRFIFDMRDFWVEACNETRRLDIEKSRVQRAVYHFFKRKERAFLGEADHIVSLTEAGKQIMQGWDREGNPPISAPISVIPCCADFSFFDPARLDATRKEQVRRELGLADGDFVLSYLGSIPPAHQVPVYLVEEMLDFYRVLLQRRPGARFLVIANNNHHIVRDAARRKGLDPDRLILTSGARDEVPYLVAQSDLAVFFIMPSFAKQACSPVKLAELLAMNVPVIGNTHVGDLDRLLDLGRNGSAVVESFDDAAYLRAIDRVLPVLERRPAIRENSRALALPAGVRAYDALYRQLCQE